MHINWPTAVQFPHYPGTELSATLRRQVSEATDDELLATYLHWTEGRITLDCAVVADNLTQMIQSEMEHLSHLVPPMDTPFAKDYHRASGDVRSSLSKALLVTERATEKAQNVWRHMCKQTSNDLAGRYGTVGEDQQGITSMETVGSLMEQTTKAELDVRNALTRFGDEMHRLALLETEMARFLASDDSFELADIHVMTPSAFEHMVAVLARRDGYRIVRHGGGARDLGADVIAVTSNDLRVVFQCKHRQAGAGKVGSPDIQTLNGTARPEHNADIVVAVTNGTFTKPASDFARSHDIQLLCQARLKRWATWGEPLLSVLGLSDATPRSSIAD
ncbi:restriction endonuclease [Streptomyces sp. NPDC048430]|uniref:restriction endonuclease n=1 Tax=Streptomyces sp. NPDC048430 TaxID=3155388 RepID=UPI0034351366